MYILWCTFVTFSNDNDQLEKQSFIFPNLLNRGYKEVNIFIIV